MLFFSHTTEKSFSSSSHPRQIGPYSIPEFTQKFRDHFEGFANSISPEIPPSKKPRLSEILAASIIVSKRFMNFYSKVAPSTNVNAITRVYDIATLILGERIQANDLALPQLISGPIDADKIDYMVRDSRACGISLGIDISRVFFRAGIYLLPNSESLPGKKPILGLKKGPLRIFVIDQSGLDTIRELGSSRQSLYSRVYYHHFTRNVEQHFHDILNEINNLEGEEIKPCIEPMRDYLTLWALSDDSIMHLLRNKDLPDRLRKLSNDLCNRTLKKRAGAISLDCTESNIPDWLESSEPLLAILPIE